MGRMQWYVEDIEAKFGPSAALIEASRWGELAEVKRLVKAGAPINEAYENGVPIILAAHAGRTPIVEYLIRAGADVNVTSPYNGSTAMIACLGGLNTERTYLAIVARLLQAGADPLVANNDGKTALDWARERKASKVEALLISAGA